MARSVEVVFTSDLSGSRDDVATYTFAVAGTDYEIDLTGDEWAAFESAIDDYVQAARQATPRRPRSTGSTRSTAGSAKAPPVDQQAVRAWALEQGVIKQNGRVSKRVREQYAAAHDQ